MSGTDALTRLTNLKEEQSTYSMEEQLESVSTDSDDLFLDEMSSMAKKSLYNKIEPVTLEDDEVIRHKEKKVTKKETKDDIKSNVIDKKFNSILDILALDLLSNLQENGYTFHNFKKEDVELVIEHIKSKF